VKCPKCSYTSYDYLKECKKCGEILEGSRRALNLKMVEPTLFTNLYSDEPEKTSLSKVEPTFIGTSKPETEQPENGFILDNDFAPPEKTEFETTPKISSEQNDLSDLGKLGSMDLIEPRSMPEPGNFNNAAEIELVEPKVDTLDDLEFTSSFADKEAATTEGSGTIELEGLEIDDLDLFTDHTGLFDEFLSNCNAIDHGIHKVFSILGIQSQFSQLMSQLYKTLIFSNEIGLAG